MYLDHYEKRKYVENLAKKWRSEVKDNDDIVLGSREASDCDRSFKSIIAFYEDKKDSLAISIKDKVKAKEDKRAFEAIAERIEFEKGFMKDLEDNPDYCKR